MVICYRQCKMSFLSDLNEYLMLPPPIYHPLLYLQHFIAISKLVALDLCFRFILCFVVL